jgi:hypothetical protein
VVVYNVFEPPFSLGSVPERAERIVFVRDGFRWMAAIFPALWLLLKGLWLEFVVFIGAVVALTWGLEALGAAPTVGGIILLILQIVLGYEASAIEGAALERRGWRLSATMVGRDLTECERNFFQSWLASQANVPAGDQPMPPPTWSERVRGRALDMVAQARRLAGART